MSTYCSTHETQYRHTITQRKALALKHTDSFSHIDSLTHIRLDLTHISTQEIEYPYTITQRKALPVSHIHTFSHTLILSHTHLNVNEASLLHEHLHLLAEEGAEGGNELARSVRRALAVDVERVEVYQLPHINESALDSIRHIIHGLSRQ